MDEFGQSARIVDDFVDGFADIPKEGCGMLEAFFDHGGGIGEKIDYLPISPYAPGFCKILSVSRKIPRKTGGFRRGQQLRYVYVDGLRTLLTLFDVEGNSLTFFESFEGGGTTDNTGEVEENIGRSIFRASKSESGFFLELLNGSLHEEKKEKVIPYMLRPLHRFG